MLLAALACTLLSQSPAEAQVEKGRVLIRQLYEEQALEVLRPLLDDLTLEPPLRARAMVYAGIAELNLGDESKAKETFARALDVDIGAVLPEWVSRRVREAFDSQLRELMAKKAVVAPMPPALIAPMPPAVVKRPIWVSVTFGGVAAAAAIVSTISFTRWSEFHRRAELEPEGISAERIDASGRPWFIVGEVLAIAAVALAGAALAWWLWPTE